MRLSSLQLVFLAAQQTRASGSSLVLFNLPQPGLPVCDLTISSESKVMKLLMPHSCFQLGIFFSLKKNMSRRMEFSQTESRGTSVQSILHIHGFCIWELNQLWILNNQGKNSRKFQNAKQICYTNKYLHSIYIVLCVCVC